MDLGVIRQAPRALNVAGAAEVLAVHTAVWDWRLGSARGVKPEWDAAQAEKAQSWVRRLEAATAEVAALTDAGIRLLMGLHEEMGVAATQPHPYRPVAGSEHWWSQNLERVTGGHFVHGEIVALGVVVASWIQMNEPEWARHLIERLGIRWRPAQLGLGRQEMRDSLETIPEFLKVRALQYYSWMDEFRLSPEAWSGLCDWLELAG